MHSLEPAQDRLGVLLGTGLSAQVARDVLALGNGRQRSLLNLVRNLEEVHVSAVSC